MATLASAQQPPAVKAAKAELIAPSLPVININACPQTIAPMPYTLVRSEWLYSSWHPDAVFHNCEQALAFVGKSASAVGVPFNLIRDRVDAGRGMEQRPLFWSKHLRSSVGLSTRAVFDTRKKQSKTPYS